MLLLLLLLLLPALLLPPPLGLCRHFIVAERHAGLIFVVPRCGHQCSRAELLMRLPL